MGDTVIIKTGRYAGHIGERDGPVILIYCGTHIAKVPSDSVEVEVLPHGKSIN